MSKISWINSSGGTWTLGSNWSGGNVPGANDNVTISIPPGSGLSGYTVELSTDVAVASLDLDQVAATLQVGDGSNDGTLDTKLDLQAGTLLLTGGTLSGDAKEAGGVLALGYADYNYYYGLGTLSDVTWQGNLQPILAGTTDTGTLMVVGSLTLTGESGSGAGTLTLEAGNVGADFVDTQTLDNATVYFGNNSQFGAPAFLQNSSDGNGAANLTLGSNLSIDVLGNGYIYDEGVITNAGTITVSGSAGFGIEGASSTYSFTNSGQMSVGAGASLSISGINFYNTGSLTIAAGAMMSIEYGNYYGSFQNTGLLQDNGTISVTGDLTTAQLEGFNITYGSSAELLLTYEGTLTNTGADFIIGAGTLPQFDLAGTVEGGTLTENGASLVGAGGTLSGVAVSGSLSIAGTYSSLTITNGLQLNPGATISVSGYQDALTFSGNEALSQAVVIMGSAGGDSLTSSPGSTLTLASSVQIEVAGGTATLGQLFFGGTIIDAGTVSVSNGAFVSAGLQSNVFTNEGVISVTGGSTLYLDSGFSNAGSVVLQDSNLLIGDASASLLNSVSLTNSSLAVAGTLNVTGATLDVGAGTSLGTIVVGAAAPDHFGASIVGGTIHDSGSGMQFEGTVTLSDLTYQGTLNVVTPYTSVTVSDLTLENKTGKSAGTLNLLGAQSTLVVAAGSVLNYATLDIGSSIAHQGNTKLSAPTIEADEFNSPPILGANLTVDQTAKYAAIGSEGLGFGIISDAPINASFKNGNMFIGGATFDNAGAIEIGGSETVISASGSFTNSGEITVAANSTLSLNLLNYYQLLPDSGTSFENQGLITLTGGTITEQSGKGIPSVPLRNDTAANITGSGTLAAEIANFGTITSTGTLALTQSVTGGGTLDVGGNDTLSLLGTISSGQTAQFGGADGVLGLAPKSFLGEIGGFASGDTIDLFKTLATAASFSGDSIVVTLTNGHTISLTTTEPLAGSLTVTSDGQGGSLIGFAGAPHEAAVISAVASGWVQPEVTFDAWGEMLHHYGL